MKKQKETEPDSRLRELEIDICSVPYAESGDLMKNVVSRILPDETKEPIGYIEQYFSNGEFHPTIYSFNIKGKEICPPTKSLREVEKAFERYVRQLDRKERKQEKEKNIVPRTSRETEIEEIRNKKNQQEKDQNINR